MKADGQRLAGGAVAVLLTLCVAAVAPAEITPPREVVGQALEQVMVILNDEAASEDDRRHRIEVIAYDHFDFPTMAKLVVARPWRKFSDEQRAEFIDQFKVHLSRSYGRRLSRYQQTDVKIVGEVEEARGDVTVKTTVVGGQFAGAMINYRARLRDDRWLAIDVVIEGVSLVSNFRSQFQPILSQGGPEELLRRLREKNAVLKAEMDAEVDSTTVAE